MPEPISPQDTAAERAEGSFAVIVTLSEPADTGPLFRRLRTVPGTTVTRERSGPGHGELGVVEALQLLVPSATVLAIAIRTLPVFIMSRRSSVTVTLTRKDRSVTVTAENLDDPHTVLQFAEHLLGDE
ncbi:effector-associated constant component EACC1 [Saccharopolyspora gloriosae]|uniref:effector-associated constant component EACC1 n=1 Tax=Saccharopolyspora gloriosae TaxID=455344 RepID=UPI001FB6B1B8|nr:hypothetical protein [Saccharopolyspora gloriosae]